MGRASGADKRALMPSPGAAIGLGQRTNNRPQQSQHPRSLGRGGVEGKGATHGLSKATRSLPALGAGQRA